MKILSMKMYFPLKFSSYKKFKIGTLLFLAHVSFERPLFPSLPQFP